MAKGKYHEWLEPDGLLILKGWKTHGLTNEEIAENMGIAEGTIYEWINRFPEISEALKNGRDLANMKVVNSLFKRATGYKYEEVTQELQKTLDGEKELVVTKKITKEVPPDVGAQAFWLKNRMSDYWRDKPVADANNEIKVVLEDKLKDWAE